MTRTGAGAATAHRTWTSSGTASARSCPACSAAKAAGATAGRGAAGAFPAARWLLIVLVVVIWLASGFYIVDASQRGVVLRFGKYVRPPNPGRNWHLPYPDRVGGDRQPVPGAHARGRLSHQRQEQGAQGIAHAHRRREHRRPAVRGAVRAEGSRGVPVQQPQPRRLGDAGGRNRHARDRWQEQDGFRAVRGARADRAPRRRS